MTWNISIDKLPDPGDLVVVKIMRPRAAKNQGQYVIEQMATYNPILVDEGRIASHRWKYTDKYGWSTYLTGFRVWRRLTAIEEFLVKSGLETTNP